MGVLFLSVSNNQVWTYNLILKWSLPGASRQYVPCCFNALGSRVLKRQTGGIDRDEDVGHDKRRTKLMRAMTVLTRFPLN